MPATLLVVDLTRMLLDELEPALGFSKLRDRVPTNERKELIELLSRGGMAAEDPQLTPEVQSPIPMTTTS
jgi:hypothetical protein